MMYTDELYHHGIKGQKWGVRRSQAPSGSLRRRSRRLEKARQKTEQATREYLNDSSKKNAKRLARAVTRQLNREDDLRVSYQWEADKASGKASRLNAAADAFNGSKELRSKANAAKKRSEEFSLKAKGLQNHIEEGEKIYNTGNFKTKKSNILKDQNSTITYGAAFVGGFAGIAAVASVQKLAYGKTEFYRSKKYKVKYKNNKG